MKTTSRLFLKRFSANVGVVSIATLIGIQSRWAGAATFLGPTPYSSIADSPFPVDGSNANFFLEDFEPPPNLPPSDIISGEFNPRGAELLYGQVTAGLSIGADDHVDGSGRNGWSGSLSARKMEGKGRKRWEGKGGEGKGVRNLLLTLGQFSDRLACYGTSTACG
jgi:hypothetical protein